MKDKKLELTYNAKKVAVDYYLYMVDIFKFQNNPTPYESAKLVTVNEYPGFYLPWVELIYPDLANTIPDLKNAVEEDNSAMPSAGSTTTTTKNKKTWVIVAIIVLLILAIALYFLL